MLKKTISHARKSLSNFVQPAKCKNFVEFSRFKKFYSHMYSTRVDFYADKLSMRQVVTNDDQNIFRDVCRTLQLLIREDNQEKKLTEAPD